MQHNNHKKESFKLLQLSDDSKSLSELELPQVSTVQNQRKRKILRKTRNTSPHSSRLAAAGYHTHAHDAATSSDGLITSACSTNFGLWIAVMMTCGWLFILSYMTAVVYSENRRLEAQLFKLSATSQTVPDELQRWHESAKWLEQNQTALLQRLTEADARAVALNKDVQALRAEFKEKYNDESDHDKVFRLQKNVANLGAQLKDLNITVATQKEHADTMRIDIDNTTSTLHALDVFAHSSTALGDGTHSSAVLTNATVLWLVHNATDDMRAQLQDTVTKMDGGKYAIEQRAAHLEEDMLKHKTSLGTLSESLANVKAQVASIELRLMEHSVAGTHAAPVAVATADKKVQPLPTTTTTPLATATLTVATSKPAAQVVGPAEPSKLDADLLSALSERSAGASPGRR